MTLWVWFQTSPCIAESHTSCSPHPKFWSGGERLLLYEAGLCPLSAGSSYRRKRALPQFPRSILSTKSLRGELLGETLTETACPGQAKTVTVCMSYFTTGDPGKEHQELTSHHWPEEYRKGQKERGDASPHVLPTSQNPPRWNPSWLSGCMCHQKVPWVKMISQKVTQKVTPSP